MYTTAFVHMRPANAFLMVFGQRSNSEAQRKKTHHTAIVRGIASLLALSNYRTEKLHTDSLYCVRKTYLDILMKESNTNEMTLRLTSV